MRRMQDAANHREQTLRHEKIGLQSPYTERILDNEESAGPTLPADIDQLNGPARSN
jgi:hypothetical protein